MRVIPIKQIPMAPIPALIQKKRGKDKEILIILFEKCNLTCSFCHQDHDSELGFNSILDKADAVIAQDNGEDLFNIHITGGELFLDSFGWMQFNDYYMLATKMGRAIAKHEITFVSNLVFDRVQRVDELLQMVKADGTNISLATSYDPCGRFTAETKKTFFQNLQILAPWISGISMVITKQNAQWFIDGKTDPVFEYIYDRFPIYVDHYTPGPDYERHQPTDAQIADMYIAMNRRYPNIQPLKSWREQAQNRTSCRSTTVITPKSEVTTCRSLITEDRVVDRDQGESIKHKVETLFMEQYGCLSCEHYQRCGLRCFLHNEHLDQTSTECHFKRMFDNILA